MNELAVSYEDIRVDANIANGAILASESSLVVAMQLFIAT
jgi:hypothetical protein